MPGPLHSEGYVDFIDRLRAVRLEAGVTQEMLADALKKPQSFVSKTERHERRLDVVEFIDWARALGRDPAELLALLSR